jgi:uncharacterized Tic20 family protein
MDTGDMGNSLEFESSAGPSKTERDRALNFQISLLICFLSCIALSLIGIGVLLFFPLIISGFVCIIMAAVKVSEGAAFRYPLCLRFIN